MRLVSPLALQYDAVDVWRADGLHSAQVEVDVAPEEDLGALHQMLSTEEAV